MKKTIQAKGISMQVYTDDFVNDYISLTDIAKYKSDAPNDVIKNWLRNKDTIEFLGLWGTLNNHNFKLVEFDGFKIEAGSNAFTMSPTKWIKLYIIIVNRGTLCSRMWQISWWLMMTEMPLSKFVF